MSNKRPYRIWKDKAATASIEFAILLPMLLILFVSAFEVGRLFWDYHVLTKAVRDGARFAARLPADCAGLTDPNDVTNVQQLTRTGTIDGSGDPVIAGWTDNSTITITADCFDNGTQTYSGLYEDQDQIPRISVSAAINFNYLFGGLVFDASTTLGAVHQETSIGE